MSMNKGKCKFQEGIITNKDFKKSQQECIEISTSMNAAVTRKVWTGLIGGRYACSNSWTKPPVMAALVCTGDMPQIFAKNINRIKN